MKIRKKKNWWKKKITKIDLLKVIYWSIRKLKNGCAEKILIKNLLKESNKIQKWDSGGCYIKWAG